MSLDRRYTLLPEGAELHPNQRDLIPHMEHRDNVLILWQTSSGKSIAIPMLGTAELDAGRSILYVASFKALAEEKADDWNEPGQPWEDIPKTAITGDYSYYDQDKLDEIKNARLISITPESLVSVITNKQTEKAAFLEKVGILIIDEGHLVAEDGRGSSLEAAIIEFMHDYPHVRLVVLSGTIPNWQDYADWMTQLNGRKTHIVRSEFRPVVLKHHFTAYTAGSAKKTQPQRIQKIMALVNSPEKERQQFLVGVWIKKFGQEIVEHLKASGINAEFHNADIKDLAIRKNIEQAFKRGSLRVLVCTKTLFTGVNLPARNVILTACEAGGEDVRAFELQQAAGRAGRPRYDTEGDVYYFIPDDGKGSFDHHCRRIRIGEPIVSQMLEPSVVAQHFIRAIYLERMANVSEFDAWYHRTLAYVQSDMDEETVRDLLLNIVEDMKKCGMVKTGDNGELELRQKGKICAQLQLDPYFFAQMIVNFRLYFAQSRPNDVDLAIAMTKVDKYYSQWLTYDENQAIPSEIRRAPIKPEFWKHAAAVFYAISGRTPKDFPAALNGALWQIRQDIGRVCMAMVRACNESEKWTEETFDTRGRKQDVSAEERIRLMFARVQYGASWERARAMFDGLSRSEINALNSVGITDIESAKKQPDLALRVLKPHRAKELRIA